MGCEGSAVQICPSRPFNDLRGFPPLHDPLLGGAHATAFRAVHPGTAVPHERFTCTIEWYEQSLKWLRTETPTESELKDVVLRMREERLKATGYKAKCWFWKGIPMGCALGDIGQDKSPAMSVLPLHTLPDVCRLI